MASLVNTLLAALSTLLMTPQDTQDKPIDLEIPLSDQAVILKQMELKIYDPSCCFLL